MEPHDDSRDLYAAYFQWVGLDVAAVGTAVAAMGFIDRGVRDAVITCLRLPGLDGFALCGAVRTTARTVHVPVIALSSCPADHERAVLDGRFTAVLMKPCLPLVLHGSLLDALAGSTVRA